jgi:zinc/manganese transport system substrate-binding protein
MQKLFTLITVTALLSLSALAQVKVVASTSDLADFATIVGGDDVSVEVIVRGTQNPHYIDVKPSYMLQLKRADVFLVVGLELEIWAPRIIDGSRNDKLMLVDCSRGIDRLEVPTGKVDRSMGDVHPLGNPHYWLDPGNVAVIMQTMVDAFSQVAPDRASKFQENRSRYLAKLEAKTAEWKRMLKPYAGAKMVTYHTSLSYFAKFFGLSVVDQIEPKPGIPPTPSHTADLIAMMRSAKVSVVALEQFYPESVAQEIAGATGAMLVHVSTSVGGLEGTSNYMDLMDHNVRALAEAFGKGKG